MPVEYKETTEYLCDKVNGLPIVANVVKNPFYTAVLIVIIMMISMMFVFRNIKIKSDDSLPKLVLRAGAYALLFVTAIQFLQNQTVINELRGEMKDKNLEEIFDAPQKNIEYVGGKVGAEGEEEMGAVDVPVATGKFNADFTK